MKKFLSIFLAFMSLNAMSQTDLIISEYVEGGGNNRALELYNPTNKEINLSAYQVVRYSNGEDVPPVGNNIWKVELPNQTIAPYSTYVIVVDKRDPNGTGYEAPIRKTLEQRADVFLCPKYNQCKAMYFSGDDAVALEKLDGTLVDLFGRWGAPRPEKAYVPRSNKQVNCWTDTKPYFDGKGIGITADHTMIRKSDVMKGVISNPALFNPLAEYDTLSKNTFNHLGWHKFDNAPANQTPVFTEVNVNAFPANSENGTVVGKVVATDAENDAIKYYCDYGNYIKIDEKGIVPFKLDKETGVITLVDKTGLNKEVKDTFNLKIVATDGYSQTDEILVRVILDGEESTNMLVSNIILEPTELSVVLGETKVITAKVSPENATDKTLTWKSNDETIATVDNNGSVKGVKVGTTEITVTANDDSGEIARCTVTVTEEGTGIDEEQVMEIVNIYPNPVLNNQFVVKAEQKIKQISVCNLVGSEIYKHINVDAQEFKVNVPNAEVGVYFVNVTLQNGKTKTSKIVLK